MPLSRARLFAIPVVGYALHLIWALLRLPRNDDRIRELRQAVADLQTQGPAAAPPAASEPPEVTADAVERVYTALLGRPPEVPGNRANTSVLDFCLSVATSEEHKQLVADEVMRARGQALQISKTTLGYMITHSQDRVIGQMLRFHETFEESDIRMVLGFIANTDGPVDKGIFLDIGANIGTHGLHALSEGFAQVIALEPDPTNFRMMRANQILNGKDTQVLNICAAASDADATGTLEQSDENFGDHRVQLQTGGTELYEESQRETQQIRLARLDTLLAEAGIAPEALSLAWIDTQGHEGQVLSGADTLLAAGTPMVMEFWPYGLARADGYPKLRAALNTGQRLYDLREIKEAGTARVMDIAALDALYAHLLQQETDAQGADGPVYTDILVLKPKTS
ncbi:MAG: FkbM family methyltransferase [Pseudomonadota bacterium]